MEALGFAAGAEFVEAAEAARDVGAKVILGDRPAPLSMRRLADAWRETPLSSWKDFFAAAGALSLEGRFLLGNLDKDALRAFVEQMKKRDNLRAAFGALRDHVPKVYEALVEERDKHMAAVLTKCDGRTVVAVVGAAHLDGMERFLSTYCPGNEVRYSSPAKSDFIA